MNNTLLNGLAVLNLLAHSVRPMGVSELARHLGIGKSGVHRLLQGLVNLDYVQRDEQSGRYCTGLRLWALGSAMRSHSQLRRDALPSMTALLQRTRHNVHLSILDGSEAVCLDKLSSSTSVSSPSGIGGRAAAHAVATGKAIVAFSGADVIEQLAGNLQACTGKTVVNAGAFKAQLQGIRACGYATSVGEWRDGTMGIAAPVLDSHSSVVASIGLSCPMGSFADENLAACADLVVQAANEVSRSAAGTIDALSAVAAAWRQASARAA